MGSDPRDETRISLRDLLLLRSKGNHQVIAFSYPL